MKLLKKKTKKLLAIFYLEKHKGFLFLGEEHPVTISFPKDVFNNLEIVDKQKFNGILESVLVKHEVHHAHVIMLLGKDLIFEKDLSKTALVDQYSAVQKFVDSVLFEEVLYKTFRVKGSTMLVATNKTIYEELAALFESQACVVDAVISETILNTILPHVPVDTITSSVLFSKLDLIKQYSLLSHASSDRGITYSNSLEINARVGVLLGIFVLLFAILCVLIYTQFTQQPEKKNVVENRIKVIRTIPTPTPSISVDPTPTESAQ